MVIHNLSSSGSRGSFITAALQALKYFKEKEMEKVERELLLLVNQWIREQVLIVLNRRQNRMQYHSQLLFVYSYGCLC